jgi:hypothetical protein
MVVEVERTLNYPLDLGEHPGQFLQTIRHLVKEVKSQEPELEACELYDIGFKRQGDQVYLRFYFKR